MGSLDICSYYFDRVVWLKDIVVIENLLPTVYAERISHLLLGDFFPLYSAESISLPKGIETTIKDSRIRSTAGFFHMFYDPQDKQCSTWWPEIEPTLWFVAEKLKDEDINITLLEPYRVKANLQTQITGGSDRVFNEPHADPVPPDVGWIFLYYVNDSDGDTFIFNETSSTIKDSISIRKRITPKANSGIFFRGGISHTASNPVITRRRININFNIKVEMN